MVNLQKLASFWKKNLQGDASRCKVLPETCKILQFNHLASTRVASEHKQTFLHRELHNCSDPTCGGEELYTQIVQSILADRYIHRREM